jgi:protease-4
MSLTASGGPPTLREMLAFGLKAKQLHSIAVVELEGTIGPRLRPGEYVKLIQQIEQNDRIRAVVLDVDSPGGSAPGSNYLYLAVRSLVRRKPVVAFIRGLGASGAYMFSCPASRIVAIPSAIVGSIGVISMHPLLYEALDKLGVQMNVTKSDRLKDMGSMFRAPTDEEKRKEQELVDDLYEQFVEAVAAGRGMEPAKVREVATGEIFTARRGKELGLVDELGDLDRAIDLAAELGNTARRPVYLRPRRSLRDIISTMAAGSIANEVAALLEERFSTRYDYRM